jgi:hypothetical protein
MVDKTQADEQSRLQNWIENQLSGYTFFDALRERRSRRFGWGMDIPDGPLAYQSQKPAGPLADYEEAALAFAACGITGYALADLSYGQGQGGSMLGGLVGRTVSSPDALNAVSVFVINDEATYLLKRPQDLQAQEIADMLSLIADPQAAQHLVEIYHRLRVKVRDGRAEAPVIPGDNFNINKWALYAKGGTYFLPVNDISLALINALIEMFDPEMGLFVIDERNFFQPAGLGKFARSRGGFLHDEMDGGRVVTVQGLEMSMAEAVAVEQGMILQNISLMAQTLGLGGYVNFARSEFAWFPPLGFRLQTMSGSKYAGAARIFTWVLKLLGRDIEVKFPVGLEKDGKTLLHAYTPPYYSTMGAAVRAWADYKFGKDGIYRGKIGISDWKDPTKVSQGIANPDPRAIDAAAAYCDYLYNRYGRFPAYSAPYRTIVGYQATRVDVSFYNQFYRPDALSATQRNQPFNQKA